MRTKLNIEQLNEKSLLRELGAQISPNAVVLWQGKPWDPLICFVIRTMDPGFFYEFDLSSELLDKLLKLKVNLNVYGFDNLTPLQILSSKGNCNDVISILLNAGADPDHSKEKCYPLPLYTAARNNDLDLVKLLLKGGAEVDGFSYANETALMAACSHDNYLIVKYLINNGAKVDAQSTDGSTPLICAAQAGNCKIGRLLIKADANKLLRDNSDKNATDHASIYHDPVLAEGFRDLGIPDIYSLKNIIDRWEPKAEYDLFFSYRHLHYRDKVDHLKQLAKDLGLTVFVDVDDLDEDHIQKNELYTEIIKHRLIKALDRSKILVWFEIINLESANGDIHHGNEMIWQYFEILHAKKALYISYDNNTINQFEIVPGQKLTSTPVEKFRDDIELVRLLADLKENQISLKQN